MKTKTIQQARSRSIELEAQVEKIMNEQVAPLVSDFYKEFDLGGVQLVIDTLDNDDDLVVYEAQLQVVF